MIVFRYFCAAFTNKKKRTEKCINEYVMKNG